MKIRFLQDYHDGERLFRAGWVCEVGPSDGKRLIQEGVAKEESSEVYSRKYKPTAIPATECVVPEAKAPEPPEPAEKSVSLPHIFSTKKST